MIRPVFSNFVLSIIIVRFILHKKNLLFRENIKYYLLLLTKPIIMDVRMDITKIAPAMSAKIIYPMSSKPTAKKLAFIKKPKAAIPLMMDGMNISSLLLVNKASKIVMIEEAAAIKITVMMKK
jgi:hypothetical protein